MANKAYQEKQIAGAQKRIDANNDKIDKAKKIIAAAESDIRKDTGRIEWLKNMPLDDEPDHSEGTATPPDGYDDEPVLDPGDDGDDDKGTLQDALLDARA